MSTIHPISLLVLLPLIHSDVCSCFFFWKKMEGTSTARFTPTPQLTQSMGLEAPPTHRQLHSTFSLLLWRFVTRTAASSTDVVCIDIYIYIFYNYISTRLHLPLYVWVETCALNSWVTQIEINDVKKCCTKHFNDAEYWEVALQIMTLVLGKHQLPQAGAWQGISHLFELFFPLRMWWRMRLILRAGSVW